MNTRDYMDAMKTRLSIESDYALAKSLNVTQQSVSRWRKGSTIGDELAPRVAEILEMKPERVLADLQAERSTNAALRDIWRRVAATFACAATVGIGGALMTPQANAFNGTQVHGAAEYKFSTRRRKKDLSLLVGV